MKIPVTDVSEPLTTDIEMFVSGGVIRYKIKFLTPAQLDVKQMRESVDYDDEPRVNYEY